MSIYTPEPILTAILGPTNTGKTHYAIERMTARSSGVIGLPLRLLAREVYDRIVKLKGAPLCALITGEEKIVPKHAQYFVCTVEAMPTDRRFAFVAIDEVQLAGHPERGHIFTDRLLHMRGTEETLFLGASTIRPLIRELVPKARHDTRERFSTLSHVGPCKLSVLPKRSVIVAFSAPEVYGLAEMMRRYRGGAAVVMGALSPRTRNAQAELYQSGEVDFLIATDAVGMGLNLDADHVAFASLRKFDGYRKRFLNPMEVAQIAGRAGRFRNDGTFGTTGGCTPMDEDLVGRIENHMFEPMRGIEWRNSALDFDSVEALQGSLSKLSGNKRLRRVKAIIDEIGLDRLITDTDVMDTIHNRSEVKRLWEVCQIPDFRNMGVDTHVRLLYDIHSRLSQHKGKLPDDWFSRQVQRLNQMEGSIDLLSARLAQIRTWTYVANKANWLPDVNYWRAATREVEDRLSDALHERLIQKFVDRRTRALMKGLGSMTMLDAKIDDSGKVTVEGHDIGHLAGLKFVTEPGADGLEAKALQSAAAEVVGPEVDRRMTAMIGAQHDIFTLSTDGIIKWGEADIGKLSPGKSLLHPQVDLIGADLGQALLRDHLAARLSDFVQTEIRTKLEPLQRIEALTTSTDVVGDARGFAFRMAEHHGLMPRKGNEAVISALDGTARADLRGAGIRFGEYYIFMPDLIKPAAANLLSILKAFAQSADKGGDGKPYIPFAGITSAKMEEGYSEVALNAAGYSGRGSRILRVDILNRLGDMIRQAKKEAGGPKFQIAMEMMALLGTSYEGAQDVLRALGYQSEPAPQKAEKPAEKTKDTKPVDEKAEAPETDEAKPEKPKAEAPKAQDSKTKAPKAESETPTAPSENASETAPETAPAAMSAETATPAVPNAPAIPNAIGVDGKPKHNMPAAPKPVSKKAKKKGPQPLNYYKPVTGQDANGNDVRGEQDLVWAMPYKKRRPKRPYQGNRGAGGEQAGAQDRKPRGKSTAWGDKPKSDGPRGKFKGGGKVRPSDRKPDNFKPKKEAMKPEDSPFAALAALKLDKKG